LHLIVDHLSNQDNVKLLTEAGEQDLLNIIESDDKNTLKVEEPKVETVKEELYRFISNNCTCNRLRCWGRVLF
jgi:hypothetical protein